MKKHIIRFSTVLRKFPKLLRIGVLVILAAIFFLEQHSGLVSLAVILTPGVTLRSKGAGNALWFKQIKLNSGGTAFVAMTSADALGAAAASWHSIGTLEKSPMERTDSGAYKRVISLLEDDNDRKYLLNKVAPISSTSTVKDPEFIAEDGTVIVATDGSTSDSTKPYFIFAAREATMAGKNHFFFFVGQFARASKRPNDIKNWNVKDITLESIDALGYTEAALPADASFTGVTAPALSGNDAFGVGVVQV